MMLVFFFKIKKNYLGSFLKTTLKKIIYFFGFPKEEKQISSKKEPEKTLLRKVVSQMCSSRKNLGQEQNQMICHFAII
jgi:hypothetical protein